MRMSLCGARLCGTLAFRAAPSPNPYSHLSPDLAPAPVSSFSTDYLVRVDRPWASRGQTSAQGQRALLRRTRTPVQVQDNEKEKDED